MPDIICLGEPIVDMVATEPSPDLVSALTFTKAAGGAPMNVAAAVARLGGSAGVICRAGADHFGEFLRQTLEGLGVDTEYFMHDTEYPTQLAFVAKDEQGVPDFSFHVRRSADTMLRPSDVDPAYLRPGRVFHFGTISLIHEPARSATWEAVHAAQDEGLLVSLDPNLRMTLWGSPADAHRALLTAVPECDVLKLSNEELMFVGSGADNVPEACAGICEMGPELVLVTFGVQGAYYHRADGVGGMVAGFTVPVVDTVGCGDAFMGALLLQLVEAEEDVSDLAPEALEGMVRLANAAAALTATGTGVMGSLPTREEAEALVRGREASPPDPLYETERGEGGLTP